MRDDRGRKNAHGCGGCRRRRRCRLAGLAALGLAAVRASPVPAQEATSTASLVFDGVTVVDVESGELVPAQRVVVAGNRIQAVGGEDAVAIPSGAEVVNANGQYLIPGLWIPSRPRGPTFSRSTGTRPPWPRPRGARGCRLAGTFHAT